MRYCFALDLKDNDVLIAEYESYHQKVWPEIIKSIKSAGIESMEIYRVANRLFMIVEANQNFSLEDKKNSDAVNPKVQEWENLMWKYQQAIPSALPGEKWVPMKKIFSI